LKKFDTISLLSQIISPEYTDFKQLKKILSLNEDVWEAIIDIANRHLLVPVLYASLRDKNLLELIKNEQLFAYMEEVYKLNTFRNEKILEQIKEICELLYTQLGVEVVLLKGVAALTESHYTSIGQRAMLDIDILVPENKIFDCINLLKEQGYSEIDDDTIVKGNAWHHYNRLYKKETIASLEIHRYPLSEKSGFMKELHSEQLSRSKIVPNAYVLNPTYELIHSFLHTQISHEHHKYHVLALRQIHHFAVMLHLYKNSIDHDIIFHFVNQNQILQIWNEFFYLINKLFMLDNKETIDSSSYKQIYYKNVEKTINNQGSYLLKFQLILEEIKYRFGYKFLSNKYNFQNRYLTPIYMLIHLPVVMYKFVFKKKSREMFYSYIWSYSH